MLVKVDDIVSVACKLENCAICDAISWSLIGFVGSWFSNWVTMRFRKSDSLSVLVPDPAGACPYALLLVGAVYCVGVVLLLEIMLPGLDPNIVDTLIIFSYFEAVLRSLAGS